jgi:hypothetical protein
LSAREFDLRSYATMLHVLSYTHPTTASFLQRAQTSRTVRLKRWQKGVRMRGYEELISHLPKVTQVYRRNKRLRPIAFLIDRAQADFATALEAALSGFHTIAHDAMRDVMEIEFLPRDFYFEPSHIQEWLSASETRRLAKFSPAILPRRKLINT